MPDSTCATLTHVGAMRRCSRLWGSFPASGKFGEASTALASRDKFAVCMSAGGKGIRVSEFRSQRSAESTKADRSRSDMRSLERLHSTRKPCIIGQQQGPGRVASPEAARQHSKISTRGFFNSLPRPDETASRAIPNTGKTLVCLGNCAIGCRRKSARLREFLTNAVI